MTRILRSILGVIIYRKTLLIFADRISEESGLASFVVMSLQPWSLGTQNYGVWIWYATVFKLKMERLKMQYFGNKMGPKKDYT